MILSSPHQNSSLPMISANIRGARTTKLTVAAIEAYRFGYLISCQVWVCSISRWSRRGW